MSALEDARAVLARNRFVGGIGGDLGGPARETHDALAALVAEAEMWEAVARLGSPVPSSDALDLRHAGHGRLLSEAEMREAGL